MRGATRNPQAVIINNTGAVQQVRLFTPSPNATGSLNATTQYFWNLTPETYVGNQQVMIDVRPKGSSLAYATLSAPLGTQNLAGVVTALNSLNVGGFYAVVKGGQSYVFTSNKYFEFSFLLLGATVIAPEWISSGSVTVNNLGITVSLGYSAQDVTTTQVLDFNDHIGGAPFVIPISTSTVFLPSQLADGDSVDIELFWNPNGVVAAVTMVITENGNIIVNVTKSTASPFDVFFTYHLNSTYVITATVN
jgi:hypothetical protein